jgi:hypothetical protein
MKAYALGIKDWRSPERRTVKAWLDLVYNFVAKKLQSLLYEAVAWSGTFDVWSKHNKEWLSANAFVIDKQRVLRRVSFGLDHLPLIVISSERPNSPTRDELETFHIKTGRAQADAVQVSLFPVLTRSHLLQRLVARLNLEAPSEPLMNRCYTWTADNEPAAQKAIGFLEKPSLRFFVPSLL